MSAKKVPSRLRNLEEEDLLILEKLGERIREIRKQRGYTSADGFALQAGIDRAQYAKYERGHENPKISTLAKILRVLEIDFPDFFQGMNGFPHTQPVKQAKKKKSS